MTPNSTSSAAYDNQMSGGDPTLPPLPPPPRTVSAASVTEQFLENDEQTSSPSPPPAPSFQPPSSRPAMIREESQPQDDMLIPAPFPSLLNPKTSSLSRNDSVLLTVGQGNAPPSQGILFKNKSSAKGTSSTVSENDATKVILPTSSDIASVHSEFSWKRRTASRRSVTSAAERWNLGERFNNTANQLGGSLKRSMSTVSRTVQRFNEMVQQDTYVRRGGKIAFVSLGLFQIAVNWIFVTLLALVYMGVVYYGPVILVINPGLPIGELILATFTILSAICGTVGFIMSKPALLLIYGTCTVLLMIGHTAIGFVAYKQANFVNWYIDGASTWNQFTDSQKLLIEQKFICCGSVSPFVDPVFDGTICKLVTPGLPGTPGLGSSTACWPLLSSFTQYYLRSVYVYAFCYIAIGVAVIVVFILTGKRLFPSLTRNE